MSQWTGLKLVSKMNKPQEHDLFLDLLIEQFLKQQVFPQVRTPAAEATYQLFGSPKVYIYSDTFTTAQVQKYVLVQYPEIWDYFLNYLEIRPRENFLFDALQVHPNSLVFVTYPDNIKEGVRKHKFALNYAKITHDLCCQTTLVTMY
jgi:hypothetical protein